MPEQLPSSENDRPEQSLAGKSGKLIAVSGAAGGVGSTSVAVNLARQLVACPGNSVALLDLDLALGDLDLQLDLVTNFTLAEALDRLAHLDAVSLKRELAVHSSGLQVLVCSSDLEELAAAPLARLPELISLLQAGFSHVVVDLSKSFSATDGTVLQRADDLLLVMERNLLSLRNAGRILTQVRNRWQLSAEICLVGNRMELAGSKISTDQEITMLGQAIDVRLPQDVFLASQASGRGMPWLDFAPRAELTRAVRLLADRWIEPGESLDPTMSAVTMTQWLSPTWMSLGSQGPSNTI